VSSDGDKFGFATAEGQIGFGLADTRGADSIHDGARLRLLVVDGDGYQMVARATPIP
jgi:hypothetical protein